ncbi:MAG: M81 family metallopeptidase [Pseudomonadota bacterium]
MTTVAIIGFQHETNTLAPMPTRYEEFAMGGSWPGLTQGADILSVFDGLNIPISGFMDAAQHWQLVPVLWTAAEPGGYVTSHAFDTITAMICQQLAAIDNLDAVYLDLHGAMVVEDHQDGEGEIVRRVREVIGAHVPIAVSLDLHGNLFPAFFETTDVVTIYRTYPHIDMADTGRRCQALLQRRLDSGQLAKAFRQLDYLIPLTSQATMREPAATVYQALTLNRDTAIISADIAMGFPPADIEHCGATLLCYGTDQSACDAYADNLLQLLQSKEQDFIDPMMPADVCVAEAMRIAKNSSKPVVVADPQDNPGAGGSGDTTGLLRALVEAQAPDVWFGMLWDPQAAAQAHEAGIGQVIDVTLGGRYGDGQQQNSPYACKALVEFISDGRFTFTGPMYCGATAELGNMALINIVNTDIHVIVSSVRTQNADAEIFRHMGVAPEEKNLLIVKSTAHFLADYTPIAETILFAEADGLNPCVVERIAYTRLRNGVRLGACGPVFNSGSAG